MWRREASTYTLREFGKGFTAASSTRAVWARNFGLAFMALLSRLHRGERKDRLVNASRRRHYPHQVPRGCPPPAPATAPGTAPSVALFNVPPSPGALPRAPGPGANPAGRRETG